MASEGTDGSGSKSLGDYYKDLKGQYKSIKTSLKASVKEGVQQTNRSLQEAQGYSQTNIVQPVESAVVMSQKAAAETMDKAAYYYERRHQYGPQVALASGAVVAGLVGMRVGGRTRLPAAVLAGGATGGAAYKGIYES